MRKGLSRKVFSIITILALLCSVMVFQIASAYSEEYYSEYLSNKDKPGSDDYYVKTLKYYRDGKWVYNVLYDYTFYGDGRIDEDAYLIDGQGNQTKAASVNYVKEYDEQGRLKSITTKNVYPIDRITEFEINDDNSFIAYSHYVNDESMYYDGDGIPWNIKTYDPDLNATIDGLWRFEFDDKGRKTRMVTITEDDETIEYLFTYEEDDRGRTVKKNYIMNSSDSESESGTVDIHYNEKGNVHEETVTDGSGNVTYIALEYNGDNQIIKKTIHYTYSDSEIDEQILEYDYTYDENGNIVVSESSITLSSDTTTKTRIEYTYEYHPHVPEEPFDPVLDKTDLTLLTKESQKLELSGVPSGAEITWTSSNPSVATVDANGVVTAKTYGKADITVTATVGEETQSLTCHIQTLFYDVPNDSVSGFKQIYWAADEGIAAGYNDGEYFGPEKACSRQEFVIFLWRTMGEPEPEGIELPFKDTKTLSDTSLKAVTWAYENGIIEGFENNTFRPNSKVTREQIVIMLWRTAGKPEATKELTFTDTQDYNKARSAYRAMAWTSEERIVNGFKDNTFHPKENSKRNQIVIMLYRFVNR